MDWAALRRRQRFLPDLLTCQPHIRCCQDNGEDGFAVNRLASASYAPARTKVSKLRSIATAAKHATELTYEKAHRLPPDHQRKQILAASSRHRRKRQSWPSAAQGATSHLPAEVALQGILLTPLSIRPLVRFKQIDCTRHQHGTPDDTNPFLSFISLQRGL